VLGFAETLDADELISVQQTFGWAVLVDEWLDISGEFRGWLCSLSSKASLRINIV